MRELFLRGLVLLGMAMAITSCGDDDAPAVVPDAGTITGGPFNFFVDGVADMVSGVATAGETVGTNATWLITDAENNILGLPPTIADLEAVNFDDAGAGVCLIWYVRYEDGLTGLDQGGNITNFSGSYDISNPIVVKRTRIGIEGGLVMLADGSENARGVAGTDQLVFNGVKTTSSATDASYWYIITDADDNILAWTNPEDRNNATVDISGAPAGTCHIWGWSYRGLGDPVVGQNISTLNDDEFEQISDNFITVYREEPDGGMISLADGSTSTAGVTGSDQLTIEGVTTNSTAGFLSYWYIITDANDNILGWTNPDDRTNATVDISGAPNGTCHIWGWSYRGLGDPVVGENISTLNDDPEEEISDNFITVYRQTPDGGMVSLMDGSTSTAGVTGSSQLTISGVTTDSEANFLSYWYIVTDDNNKILTWVPANDMRNNATIDISGAPDGTCRIWGWSYRGLGDPVMGNDITTLGDDPREDVSDNYITVYRQTPDGGTVTLANGETNAVGVTGTDQLTFSGVTTNSEANFLSYWYIITDNNGDILTWVNANDARNNATIDISGAPDGTCRIYGWSYRGLDNPVVGSNISTLNDDAEEEISDNWITVYRQTPNGGTVSLAGGSTMVTGQAGTNEVVLNGVTTTSNANFLSYWYIVTDDNDNILTWVNANDSRTNATVDLSGAPAGTCRVWGWSYRGLANPVVGENISTLNNDVRETISDNFITVVRQ